MKLKEPIIAVFLYNESNEAIIREVKTGAQDDEYIHIKEGLKEGDEVITGPYEEVSKRLKNKDKVKKEVEK